MELVEQHAFVLERVPFDKAGVYEFRLFVADSDEPLAAEQVRVLDVLEDLP